MTKSSSRAMKKRAEAVVSPVEPELTVAGNTKVSLVSKALVSLSPSISLFLSVGPGLLWMKFQQGYEGIVHGV